MTARETWRRIGIWSIVAAFFAVVVSVAVLGDWTGWGFAAWAVVGAVILTERPGNGVGRILLGMAVYAALTTWSLVPELVLDVPAWAESIGYMLSGPFWTLVYCVTLLFPNGRFESRVGKAVFGFTVGFGALLGIIGLFGATTLQSGRANPFLIPALAGLDRLPIAVNFAALLLIFAGVVLDIVLRWRRAGGIERLQFRWFVAGAVAFAVVLLVALPLSLMTSDRLAQTITLYAAIVGLNLPAIAIGIAITRHGLYSIGRVISRTVAYAIVTLLAVGVYAGIVTSVTLLLPSLPSVGVALATLAAAALFLPLLRLVQRRLDRRFDRERYNAERVVAGFGEHVRSDADPGAATGELVAAVEQTLQPTIVGLWTADGPR